MVFVSPPMLIGAMCGPPAVRTLERDRSRLSLGMSIYVLMIGSTDWTRGQRLDSFSTSSYGRKGGLGKRMEKVILGKCRLVLWPRGGLFEEIK